MSKRHAVQGIIIQISGSLLTIAHQIHRDRLTQVLVSDATLIKTKTKESSPSTSLESSSSATLGVLQVGYRIVAVGDLNENGIIVARMIHIIPGKAKGIYRRFPIGTPSASLSPTVTVTSSATPSAAPEATSSAF